MITISILSDASWLLNTVIQLVLPLNSQTCPHLLGGVLGVTRQLVTNCHHCDEVEPLLLLYELCIKLTGGKSSGFRR